MGIHKNPSFKLDVNGKLNTSGITETSDARIKKDVAQLEDGICRVEQLRDVTYKWRQEEFPNKEFEEDNQIGVIAHEVEDVLPEVVHTDKQRVTSP